MYDVSIIFFVFEFGWNLNIMIDMPNIKVQKVNRGLTLISEDSGGHTCEWMKNFFNV